MPGSLLGWLRSFGVVADQGDGKTQLTETGESWADLVTWEPEVLSQEISKVEGEPEHTTAQGSVEEQKFDMPKLSDIRTRIADAGNFHPALIATLHAGIWSHHRRHFAILTGLSGSGKTLLARAYAKAISPCSLCPSV